MRSRWRFIAESAVGRGWVEHCSSLVPSDQSVAPTELQLAVRKHSHLVARAHEHNTTRPEEVLDEALEEGILQVPPRTKRNLVARNAGHCVAATEAWTVS